MTQFTGTATRLIPLSPETVWNTSVTLNWLGMGWDDVQMTQPAAVGVTFVMIDERKHVTARWTTVKPHQELAWTGDDGSSGHLLLRPSESGHTLVEYTSVNVPHAIIDKLFAGIYAALFPAKAQAEADKHANRELQSLAHRSEHPK